MKLSRRPSAAFVVASLLVALMPGAAAAVPVPSAADRLAVAAENAPVDILLLASDPDSLPQTFTIVTGPTHGSLDAMGPVSCPHAGIQCSAVVTYTPDTDYLGTDAFTYRSFNGLITSSLATVSITVAAANTPPTATVDPSPTGCGEAVGEDMTNWVDGPSGVLVNDSDPEGASLSARIVTQTSHGVVQLFPNGGWAYTPEPNYQWNPSIGCPVDSFTYVASDGQNESAPTQVSFWVVPVNDPPSFAGGTDVTALEDSGPFIASGWATAIDPGPLEDYQTVSFTVSVTDPTLFSAGPTVSTDGTLSFTPAANAFGATTVTVTPVDDGGALYGGLPTGTPATFTVTIDPVNDPPMFALSQSVVAAIENDRPVTVPGFASSWTPGATNEYQHGTFSLVTADPSLFTAQPAVDDPTTGSLTFETAESAWGTTRVDITLTDDGGTSNGGSDTTTETFTIRIDPTAADDTATIPNTAGPTPIDVLYGDYWWFPPYTITTVTQGAKGVVAIAPGGDSLTYDPDRTAKGSDVFTYTSSDRFGKRATATVHVTITDTNTDPLAVDDVASVPGGGTPTLIDVVANDTDPDGDALSITGATDGSAGGSVVVVGGGDAVTYLPPSTAFLGTDSFTYTVSDAHGGTAEATATVTVVDDTLKPVVSVPLATIVSPSTLGTTSGKARISWSASDVGTGLKSIQLQESYKGGPFKTVALASPRAASVVRTVLFGKAYRYRVRATDVVGNVSAYVVSPTFVASRSQESSAQIVYAGPWRLARSATYSGGKARYATRAGASATFTFSGRSIAWVSSKSASRGSAQVLLDGVLVKTVSLHRSSRLARQVVFSARWAAAGPHTIEVVVLGTAGHPRVDIDTFVVVR